VLDLVLVRFGPFLGVGGAIACGVVAALVARVFILWRRRRAIEATFGGSEPLDEGAVGRVVTVEGVLSATRTIEGHTGASCVASSVRAGVGDAIAHRHTSDLALSVRGRSLVLEGEVEVSAGREARTLDAARRDAILATLGGRDVEVTGLVAHSVRAGDRVLVTGKLVRSGSEYREGGLALGPDEQGRVRIAALVPSPRTLRRPSALVGAITTAAVLGLVQVAAWGAYGAAREPYRDGRTGRVDALPLASAHRITLLGLGQRGTPELFDRALEVDRPTEDLVALAVAAHDVRGECAASIEVLGRHGLFDEARARGETCNDLEAQRVLAAIDRADGRLEAALARLEPHADALRELGAIEARQRDPTWWGLLPLLFMENGRYDDAARALALEPGRLLTERDARRCLGALLTESEGGDVTLPEDLGSGWICSAVRRTLEGASPSAWLSTRTDDLGRLAALSTPGTEPMGQWLDGMDPDLGALVRRGGLPRWDGLARAALEGARRRTGDDDVREIRCRLAESEALHRYRRTGTLADAPNGCVYDTLALLAALEAGTPVDDEKIETVPGLVSTLRHDPSLPTLRSLVLAFTPWDPPSHISFEASREPPVEEPPSPVETAALRGDARVLERLLGARVAVLAARSHHDQVRGWHTLRRRDLGHPTVSLARLREEAYDDRWIALSLGDTEAAAAAEARIDRLTTALEDPRRVFLLQLFGDAIGARW
jgi:hypothetical protein